MIIRTATSQTRLTALAITRWPRHERQRLWDTHGDWLRVAIYDIANGKSCSLDRENNVRQALGMAPLRKDSRKDVRPRIRRNVYDEVFNYYDSIEDALTAAILHRRHQANS